MQLPIPRLVLIVVAAGLAVTGCRTSSVDPRNVQAEIRAALERQVRDWNAGDLAGFMETYAKSGKTRFASGGDISRGWQTVFDRYKTKYGDRAAMGTLSFSDLEVTPLGSDAAEAFGHWRLQRAEDTPSGLFTLLFQKTPEGWRIVHDHTSSATK
jgi:ketosteroid isomerase-like protein